MDNINITNQKVKCLICYKLFKKKNKSIHIKSKHHLICEEIIKDIKFKTFQNLNIEKIENNKQTNFIDFICSQI